MQPWSGSQMLVVEARHKDGSLDVKRVGTEPGGARGLTFDALYRQFFAANPDAEGTWPNLAAWLNQNGWVARPKTW